MSLSRKIVFSCLLLLATWLVVEGIAFVALGIVHRSLFPQRAIVAQMRTNQATEAATAEPAGLMELKWGDYAEVIHPYFGFVADPVSNKPVWDVSDNGFIFSRGKTIMTKRSKDRLVVAVFGGSFANGTYLSLKALFEAKAAELHRQVDVINFSSAGYKQPQQLMVLSYLFARGAEFDLVINVDGFNEVALPSAENVPNHVNPFFPRGWDRRTAGAINQANVRRIGYIEYLKERRAAWSGLFLGKRLYLSPTLCLLWEYRDRAMSRGIYATELDLQSNDNAVKSYTMRGPPYPYTDDAHLFADLAGVWANSSVQMNALCLANGARYYHFLQPNQYLANSKPMGEAERKRAITPGQPYAHGVVAGYPGLIEAGKRLPARGVDFTDLTQLYANVPEPIYIDDCCHVNGHGQDLVAQRIYDEIYKK